MKRFVLYVLSTILGLLGTALAVYGGVNTWGIVAAQYDPTAIGAGMAALLLFPMAGISLLGITLLGVAWLLVRTAHRRAFIRPHSSR